MDRRDFLRISAAGSATLALPGAITNALAQTTGNPSWRIYEVTTRVEVLKPQGVTRVWVPLPLAADTDYQKSLGNSWDAGTGMASGWKDAKYASTAVAAEWPEAAKPALEVKSRFASCDRAVDLTAKPGSQRLDEASRRLYTMPTDLIPTDGIVRETALKVTRGANTDLEKARAIYEWVVENTYRDPKTRGCGIGDIKFLLESGNLGGKCADLNALFVGMARSVGVPARDIYGVRTADSRLGYKSLGKSGDITKAQHCRADFYVNGHGWVPVDPADVRKVILEEPPGKLPIDEPRVKAARERLFGSWEGNWLGYNYGHDLVLPGSTRGPVGYLMYPQCETSEGRLDCLDPDNFKYTMVVREISLA
jgi:transglutaminase-like putative cysteine protease